MARNKVHIHTFGCRLNIWESEVMREQAEKAGLANVNIVNSCAVTAEAEKQTRQMVRRLKKEHPDTPVVLTGCAVQIDPQKWAEMEEADYVLGNHDKLQQASWHQLADKALAPQLVSDIMEIEQTASHMVDCFDEHTRAFLQIQQGCDHRCTFCIIPFGRGPSRSVSSPDIVAQIKSLVAGGTSEIVLTGVDITSWGSDLASDHAANRPRLGRLVLDILEQVPQLPRLRLSSIDPAEPDHLLMQALSQHARLMPHLHLSVQHGDDMILKRMKRRHLARDVLRFCEEVRRHRPDAVFGADMICGFPTETEQAHHNSLALLERAGITYLHVFGYSPREGTPAAQMPQCDKATIKQRVSEMRACAHKRLLSHYHTRVGSVDMMLVESNGLGHLSSFETARLDTEHPYRTGDLVAVQISHIEEDRLIVTPLKNRDTPEKALKETG